MSCAWTFQEGHYDCLASGHSLSAVGSGDSVVDGVYISTTNDELEKQNLTTDGNWSLQPSATADRKLQTVSAWVKIVQTTENTGAFQVNYAGNTHQQLPLWASRDNTSAFLNTSGGNYDINNTADYSVDDVLHVVYVKRATDFVLYENGSQVAIVSSIPSSYYVDSNSLATLRIGGINTYNGAVEIDECRMYWTDLSASEIAKQYEEGPHR